MADMHALLIIIRAGFGFSVVALLGLLRMIIPLRLIDRWRVRILCSLVNLGMGIDDAAIERLRKIPDAVNILEQMIEDRGSQNYQFAQQGRCSSPEMVLQMMRSHR